jgi:hypothetical protein
LGEAPDCSGDIGGGSIDGIARAKTVPNSNWIASMPVAR